MKNAIEFDYDKKKPNLEKYKIKNLPEMKKEKTENLSSLFNHPSLKKGIEIIQGDIAINPKEKDTITIINLTKTAATHKIIEKINNYEITKEKEIEKKKELKEEISLVFLPETQIILPDKPLEQGKKPNIIFCKNLVENIYDQQKSEINICLIDGIGSILIILWPYYQMIFKKIK